MSVCHCQFYHVASQHVPTRTRVHPIRDLFTLGRQCEIVELLAEQSFCVILVTHWCLKLYLVIVTIQPKKDLTSLLLLQTKNLPLSPVRDASSLHRERERERALSFHFVKETESDEIISLI